MKRLRPNVRRFYKNNVEGTQLLERGEVAMLPLHNGRVLGLAEAGIPVKWIAPTEGAYPGPVSYHIPKGTKNKDLCYKFIDFAISAEAQSAFCSEMRYGSVNKNAKLTAEAAAWVPPLSALKDVDWYKIIPLRSAWLERWNREVAS
jgi:putative spermidine/putrescine transport system substrate-binding protein